MKLLITNLYNLFNMGEVYHIMAIRQAFPNAEIAIDGLYSICNESVCEKLRLNWIGDKKQSNMVVIFAGLFRRMVKPFDCDLVIDLGGDTFSEKPQIRYAVAHALVLLPYAIRNRKYVVISQSIGELKATKLLSKYVLRKAHSVVVRDVKSWHNLYRIGIKSRVAQDLAYGVFYDRY